MGVKFSIIIPVQRIHDYLREHLKHHLKQKYQDFEIIILSDIKEKDKFEKTKIIETGKVPPAKKRNLGVENAQGEIIAFIDDDAYPQEDWLEIANKEFQDKELIALGGPSLPPPNSTFFQKVSNKVYELSSKKTGPRYGKAKRQEIDDWPTCNLFVRKKDFLRVGGADSKYWGGEDTNLCYNLLKTGKKMIYVPEIGVFHHPRKSLKNHLKQSYFWGMWRGFFMKIHPENSRQATFFIPPTFLIGIVIGGILSLFSQTIFKVYLWILVVYVLYLLFLGIKTKNLKLGLAVMGVTFLTHLIYGAGFLRGIAAKKSIGPIRKGMHSYEKLNSGKKK